MSSQITITGNLTDDPEIRYFDSGTAKASFSVASNRTWTDDNGEKKEQTSYFKVEAWRFLAEDVSRVLSKGVRVVVSGRLEQRQWTDKETNEKRNNFVLVADNIGLGLISVESFQRRKGGNGETAVATTQTKTATRPAAVARPKLPTRPAQQETEEEPF
jgi:single-strand DNA-binding protein